MNRLAIKNIVDLSDKGPQLDPYVPISAALKFNWNCGVMEISSSFVKSGESNWRKINIGSIVLPPSPVNKTPLSLISRIELCVLLVAAVDQYLLSTKPSKSRFTVIRGLVKLYGRLFEYMWLQGYYRLSDVPREEWTSLANKLANGGWMYALEIPSRIAALIARVENLNVLYGSKRDFGSGMVISSNFKKDLGTNFLPRPVTIPKAMLRQAVSSEEIRLSGDIDRYDKAKYSRLKAGAVSAALVAFNRLAAIKVEGAPSFVPAPGAYEFGLKYGAQDGRTENLTPDIAAKLLVYSFDWVVNKSEPVLMLMEDISEDLLDAWKMNAAGDVESVSGRDLISKKIDILMKSKMRPIAEEVAGRQITKFNHSKSSTRSKTGFLDLLFKLVSSCFLILAFMNARRKDEIQHPVIGMHAESMRVIDSTLQLYQCEFYIEKTLRDYDLFWITDISRRAIEVMIRISNVAWRWAEVFGGKKQPTGRERKLFVIPKLANNSGDGYREFEFKSHTTDSKSFVVEALQGTDVEIDITPHMLRRGYGLIQHYRYEHPELAALGRKYRHIDLVMPLRYVTNGWGVGLGDNAAAVWSAPQRTILDARRDEERVIQEEIVSVGKEKLEKFVEDVIDGEKRFGGGFAKIVHRFNRYFSNQIDYQQLNKRAKTKALTETLLSRGHMPHPYPHATCMAGQERHGAACAKNGELARESAGAVVCGGCRYSCITSEHIVFMEEELERLDAEQNLSPGTLRSNRSAMEWLNVQRIIILQKSRLEAADAE
jgi:hypothetical protein